MRIQAHAVDRQTRPLLLLAAVAALILSLMAIVGPAMATHVPPEAVAGNAACGELGDYDHEFKIDATPETKSYSDPNSDFEVAVTVNAGATVMSFSSNLPVDAVFVKGGNEGGNLYVYDPAVTSDTGLTTPTGQQISHVSFCFNDVPEETPTPTPVEETPTPTPVEETPTPTPEQTVAATPTPTPTPEQSVQAATGTPAASQPNTAMGSEGAPSPLPTVVFGLLLLASLGALAYANVKTVRSRS